MSEGVLSALPHLTGLRHPGLDVDRLGAVQQLSAMLQLTSLESVFGNFTAADMQEAPCKQISLVRMKLDDIIAFTPEFVGLVQGLTRLTELDLQGHNADNALYSDRCVLNCRHLSAQVLPQVCRRFSCLLREPVCKGVWGALEIRLVNVGYLDCLLTVLRWSRKRRAGVLLSAPCVYIVHALSSIGAL